eukprot:1613152-Rhodomonas_salina.1
MLQRWRGGRGSCRGEVALILALTALAGAHAFAWSPVSRVITPGSTFSRCSQSARLGRRQPGNSILSLRAKVDEKEGAGQESVSPSILDNGMMDSETWRQMSGIEEFDRAWRTAW